MTYTLRNSNDTSQGDSGGMSLALRHVNGETEVIYDSPPIIGYAVRVGSQYTRTFSSQDYWTTSYVKRIIERTDNIVKFETENGSIYFWGKL